jgi:hypothetical protein
MNSRMALITFLDSAPAAPDNSLPGSGSGGGDLPPGGATLPVYPFDPTVPDNALPGAPAPIRPGARFVVKWLACKGLILVPDNSLPPAEIDNTLPPTPAPKK